MQEMSLSFVRSFLRDNFDYDAQVAMKLLADHGMMEKLFEVAKVPLYVICA